MSFNMKCPFCQKEVQAEEQWEGQEAQCPYCSHTIIIVKPEPNLRPIINVTINNENQFSKGGRNNRFPGVQPQIIDGKSIPDHLTEAILATVFCCMPFGIVSIIYAMKVNSLIKSGDLLEAQDASRKAYMWYWVSFSTGLAFGLIYFICSVAQNS